MYKEYFKELKNAAPKMMEQFCDIYGYTEFEGEYYNDYLIRATKPKQDYVNIKSRIKFLQNNYDGCLENFKLNIMSVIGHLEANKYTFNMALTEKNQYSIQISKYIRVETDKGFIEYALQDASIVAAEHLEKSLVNL